MTINPHVAEFLTIYSQSERSTGGTRDYDQKHMLRHQDFPQNLMAVWRKVR